ncbi:MAG: hypothetical protein LBG16_02860, partial [Elusimicrobiota bacterium]|nr:hypothetical protein [Elusimicrobiota bacterium]
MYNSSSANPNDNILDIYGRVDRDETVWDYTDPDNPVITTPDDPSTVGNAYGSYVTNGSISSASNNNVTLYPKEPPEGGSAGAMVSGDAIGAYINSTNSLIVTNAQNNEVDFKGARAGADEEQWRAHGGYGAIIKGTA